MSNRRLAVALGLLAAPAAAFIAWQGGAATPAEASPRKAAHAVVVLVATHPGASISSLYEVEVGATATPPPVATFSHAPSATVRATSLPGRSGAVAATAEIEVSRDASFAAGLFGLEPHTPARLLCDRVAYANRPVVTSDGHIYVARGTAGSAPSPSKYREDELTVDEIDFATGDARTVLAHHGYLAFVAAAQGREVFVYRVGPTGADLAAVDLDTLVVRSLGGVVPLARDFSVDETGGLVFEDRSPDDLKTWVVRRISPTDGATRTLFSGAEMNLAPTPLRGGRLLLNPAPQSGFQVLGADGKLGAPLPSGAVLEAPLGGGVDAVEAVDKGGRWLAATHRLPRGLPTPFAVELETGHTFSIPAPHARVAIAGIQDRGDAADSAPDPLHSGRQGGDGR